jgi:hypothetical protein
LLNKIMAKKREQEIIREQEKVIERKKNDKEYEVV